MRSRHVSRVVATPPERVYAVAVDPARLPQWAHGLVQSVIRRDGDLLVADSPMGEVRVRFAPSNDLGVIDHDVTLPDGYVTTNPMRG